MKNTHGLWLLGCLALAGCGGDESTEEQVGTVQQGVEAQGLPSFADCQQDLAKGKIVLCGQDGKLQYAKDAKTGATVLDFGAVGYKAGAAPLPTHPLRQTVAPSGKDDTQVLQAAINAVSALKPDANGVRGRVRLAPGLFHISQALVIAKDGVSVEGTSSMGRNATTIQLGGNATMAFYVRGANTAKVTGKPLAIAKLPVVSGASQLTLAHTEGLSVGQQIRITSPRNLAWITQKWGGHYPPVRDGKKQAAWGQKTAVITPRTITGIAGNTITLDVPLPDTIPAANMAEAAGATVQPLDTSSYIHEFGFAHLRLSGRFQAGEITNPKLLIGFVFANAENGWIDDVEVTDFGSGTVHLDAWSRHITVQDVRTIRTDAQTGSAKPSDIAIEGQLNLIQGCSSNGNRTFYVATQKADAAGPNVVQNYRAAGMGTFEPHQRWSTGVLYDNIYAPDAGIALIDRGIAGSGHGWAMGFGVVYNSLAGTGNKQRAGMNSQPGLTINQPPASANWGIGLVGPNHSVDLHDARYDSAGKPAAPASLWAYQLWQKRGSGALSQVIGPWHVRDSATGLCLSVDVAKAKSYVLLRECTGKKQLALWDVTRRGNIRLGGTSLCLDAGSDRRNTPVQLAPCEHDDEQRWVIGARGGQPTQVQLRKSGNDTGACLAADNQTVVVGPCTQGKNGWRVVLTHLAR